MHPHFKLHHWQDYSLALKKKILNPQFQGSLSREDYDCSEMRLVTGQQGRITDGYFLKFYIFVDETDGVIADIRYQLFGETALIGAAEILSALVMRKNYDQARRISTDLIEKEIQEKGKGFPKETAAYLNVALSALDDALEKCEDIPFADAYTPPPTPVHLQGEGEHQYPHFLDLSENEKKAVICQVIDQDIRPYIELDAGGVDIVKIEGFQILIAYQGACTSCFSATGATLSAIEQILRAKVHPAIQVEADPSTLTFLQN